MPKKLLTIEYPDIAAQWKGDAEDLKKLSIGSDKKGPWECSLGHLYEMKTRVRTARNRGCPYCSNSKALAGFNDLKTLAPASAVLFDPENDVNLEEVTIYSQVPRRWRCAQGHEWILPPVNQVARKHPCLLCDRASVPADHHIRTLWDAEKNTTPIDRVTLGSSTMFAFACPHGHKWQARFADVASGKSGCPTCSNRKVAIGFNDLASAYPEIAAQWSSKNAKRAEEVSHASRKKAWWHCSEGHEWQAEIDSRKRAGCPVCSNRVIHAGVNDLKALHPRLYKEVVHKRPGISPASKRPLTWACDTCGNVWKSPVVTRVRNRGEDCAKCYPASRGERDLADFIQGLFPDEEVVRNDRSIIGPLELDIVVPSRKVAVEFNGAYWHSEEYGKDKWYHHEKWKRCLEKGYQLIQVWSDTWENRPEAVKAMIASKLGANQRTRVYGRTTSVTTVPLATARDFFDKHHVQGWTRASIYLGLEHPDLGLVAVCAFRISKREVVLERYATCAHVIGGQSKLLSAFDRTHAYDRMITFADLEVSDGNLYEQTGWVKDRDLLPDYKYLVGGTRVHKFNYRLARFKTDSSLTYEEGLSERELARLNGLMRVWDSGKIRYVRNASGVLDLPA